MQDGKEACDDGNAVDLDGCDKSCKIEAGWLCPTFGVACVEDCGDGVKVGKEQCDDANKISGDGCSSSCRFELGYYCLSVGNPCTTKC